jgi:hypothetical protein
MQHVLKIKIQKILWQHGAFDHVRQFSRIFSCNLFDFSLSLALILSYSLTLSLVYFHSTKFQAHFLNTKKNKVSNLIKLNIT